MALILRMDTYFDVQTPNFSKGLEKEIFSDLNEKNLPQSIQGVNHNLDDQTQHYRETRQRFKACASEAAALATTGTFGRRTTATSTERSVAAACCVGGGGGGGRPPVG